MAVKNPHCIGEVGDPPRIIRTFYRVKVFRMEVTELDTDRYTGKKDEEGNSLYDKERVIRDEGGYDPIYQCDSDTLPSFMKI